MKKNHMQLLFDARSENECFARVAVAAFLTDLNPTLEELADIKTAVSEAVTNAIIHGYQSKEEQVMLVCSVCNQNVEIIVQDHGIGIADVKKAMEPFYTTKPELERSGMGFAFMEAFMDELEVYAKPKEGTKIIMRKQLGKKD